jgi:hypothetical protein
MKIVHSLYEQARQSRDNSYLEDAFSGARRVAACLAASGVSHLGVTAELGRCLSLRYRLLGDNAALLEAIDLYRTAVIDVDPGNPDLPACWNNLGNALSDWHQLSRDNKALTEAEDAFRQAAELLPEDDPRLGVTLSGLGDALLNRYWATSQLGYLDEAITVAERAVASAWPGDPGRPIFLNSLANVLTERYRRAGDADALIRAELILRQAAAEAGADTPDRALALNALGAVLNCRYEASGNRDALAEAELVAAECVSLTPPGNPARGGYLNNLGGIRWNTYLATGDLRAQRESADAYCAAVAALPESHEHYALSLGNLAGALIERHETIGDLSALDEGIGALRRATELISPPDPRLASCLSRLGSALLRRYERLGGNADLAEAEDAARRAVNTAPGDIERPMFLSDLSSILHRCYKDGQDPSALDAAEAAAREALASTADDAPGGLLLMSNLGNVLLEQYRRSQRTAILDETIGVLREAERRAGQGDIHRPAILANLGEALRRRHGADPAPAVLAEALTVFSEAAAIFTAAPLQRAAAARAMGELAASAERWPQATEAYRLAVELLPAVASRELNRGDKENRLANFTTLASNAAAAALQADDAYQAISVLEGGRGVLFAHSLQLRSPLDDLRAIAPSTADRFQYLGRQLSASTEAPHRHSPATSGPGPCILGIADEISRRQQIAQERSAALTEIRAMPGFEDFLRLPAPQQVLDDAGTGPVVVLNVSRYRSDALILSEGSIQVVPLPAATPQAVGARAIELSTALAASASPVARLHEREQAEEKLLEILDWLWHAVTGPVLGAISLPEAAPETSRPRLWWVPTGLLSLLPLHAAATVTVPRQAVTNQVISSYAPTIRALGQANKKRAPSADGRTLIVTVPSAPDVIALPAAAAEGEAVAALIPHTLLTGAAATRDRLLRELPLHGNLHFAGHAIGDLSSPSASALLMYDGPVTARDISQLELTGANTAYLSACETAASEITLIDEAINVASGCLLAGFRHVIATLWPVRDRIAVTAAKQIWQAAHDADEHPAISVDQVTRKLRQQYPRKPSIWAAYIHAGP